MCLINNEKAIDMVGVMKRFKGLTVLQELSLCVLYGEIVGITGANGVGKSLLLRIISGMVVNVHLCGVN